MKRAVVVSRQWNNPAIEMWVSDEEIGIQMSLSEFWDSIVEEMGNPTLIVSKAQLRARLEAAANQVLTEMKNQTTRIV